MVFGLSWWVWLLVFGIVAAYILVRAARAWRAGIRAEFIAYLRREAPEWEVVAERDDAIEVRGSDAAAGTLRLQRLYDEGTAIENGDAAAREALFAKLVGTMREGGSVMALDPERDRSRLRPRLVNDDFLRRLRAEVAERKEKTLTALPSGVPGLSTVLVLDNENSVAYLTDDLLADLKLSPDQALELAKENLARSVDVAPIVRGVFEKRALMMVKSFDSYDAARILLVPACLAEGQEVAAVIPDRDTLGLVLPPADGDWSGLRKLARTPAGDILWREPLLVRSTGISAVPSPAVR